MMHQLFGRRRVTALGRDVSCFNDVGTSLRHSSLCWSLLESRIRSEGRFGKDCFGVVSFLEKMLLFFDLWTLFGLFCSDLEGMSSLIQELTVSSSNFSWNISPYLSWARLILLSEQRLHLAIDFSKVCLGYLCWPLPVYHSSKLMFPLDSSSW